MPRLKNLKHEQFCLNYIANGHNVSKAYKNAYKCRQAIARQAGCRLFTNVYVEKRLKELIEPTLGDKEKQARDWLEHTRKAALFNIKSIVKKMDSNSIEFHDFKKIDGDLISSVIVHQTKYGNAIEVKTHNKLKALELLGRYHKFFAEDKDGGGQPSPNLTQINTLNVQINNPAALSKDYNQLLKDVSAGKQLQIQGA